MLFLVRVNSFFSKMASNKKSPIVQFFDWLEDKFFFFFGKGQFQPIIPQPKKDFFHSDPTTSFVENKEKANEYLLADLEEKSLLFWQMRKNQMNFSSKQRLFFFLFVFLLTSLGLFTDNLLLSIISILTGLLFWIFQNDRTSEPDTFGITETGVFANDSFYEFSSLKSFWIFLESQNDRQELFLANNNLLQPEIHLPIPAKIALEIRTTLLQYLPEEKPQEKVLDSLRNSLKL